MLQVNSVIRNKKMTKSSFFVDGIVHFQGFVGFPVFVVDLSQGLIPIEQNVLTRSGCYIYTKIDKAEAV